MRKQFLADTPEKVSGPEVMVEKLASPVDLIRVQNALGDNPEEILEILNFY